MNAALIKSKASATRSLRYVFWQDAEMWLGYLQDYPDYLTQGTSLGELEENLKDIHGDLTSGAIPSVRKIGELMLE